MTEKAEKAARAQRLRDDEVFAEFIAEVRNDAMAKFLTSGPRDTEAREEAHAIIRALNHIEGALQAACDDFTIEQKGQHRGSD